MATAVSIGGPALAQAALTDPPDTSSPQALTDDLQNTPQENPETIPDTSITPIAEEGTEDWKQVGGALFPTKPDADPTQLVEGSPTKYADNLFDVDFAHSRLGMAGGTTCGPALEDSDPDADRNPERAPNCHPVAYLFTETDEDGEVWSPLALPGANRPGYIGAIAWLDSNTAMAVGGSGTYPRREAPYGKTIDGKPCTPIEKDSLKPWQWNCDQAGEARAWLYDANQNAFCELGVDEGCPELPQGRGGEPAHGLTALDFKPATESDPVLGFAGGLGQIFAWHGDANGSWDPLGPEGPGGSVDNESPGQQGLDSTGGELWQQTTTFIGPTSRPGRLFRFRVREIRFAPIDRVRAYVVTSGCCSPYDTTDRPLMLTYSDYDGKPIPAQWFLHQARPNASTATTDPEEPGRRLAETAGQDLVPKPRPDSSPPAHQSGLEAPNSLYSLTTVEGNPPPIAVLASPASTGSALEQRSEVWGCASSGQSHTGQAPNRNPGDRYHFGLGTARLLAIDGWVARGAIAPTTGCAQMPEWAVGELRSQRTAGQGRRGLVSQTVTNAEQIQPVNVGISGNLFKPVTGLGDDPEARPTPDEALGGWEPTSGGQLRGSIETLDSLTTSYTLNAVQVIAEAGEAWAVGDHGAVLRLGDESATSGSVSENEPPGPRLGTKTARPLPDRNSYQTPAPAKNAAALPGVGSQPAEALAELELGGAGSPDATHDPGGTDETEDVAEIVMSRDGSEGWAIGTNPLDNFSDNYGTATFYHYDGATWRRCDPRGIVGQLAPDTACVAVAGLRRWLDETKAPQQTQIVSATRVPLENDDDPTNDDEFEVVAVGTDYMGEPKRHLEGQPVILRYREGRWSFEEPEARRDVRTLFTQDAYTDVLKLRDVAFTAPDDGWILAEDSYTDVDAPPEEGTGGDRSKLFHFDGSDWERCPLGRERGAVESECGSERIPLTSDPAYPLRMVAAGERVYLFGMRNLANGLHPAARRTVLKLTPLILYHERGNLGWTDGHGKDETGGGYDPGWQDENPGVGGFVYSLAVNRHPDGSYSGWAQVRRFERDLPDASLTPLSGGHAPLTVSALLMRLDRGAREWRPFEETGALSDYLAPQQVYPSSLRYRTEPHLQALTTNAAGEELALIAQRESGRLFSFDEGREGWRLVPSERPPVLGEAYEEEVHGLYQAIAPDNRGGAWAAVKNACNETGCAAAGGQVFFYHYTDHPPEPVFSEAPQPFGDRSLRITGLTGSPDGSLWASTNSSTIARYERASGWQTAQIPGWDPGRIVTRSSEVNAVSAAPDGSAVAVGRQGRIANLTPTSIGLDEAASVLCEGTGLGSGCGTTRDLRAVSVSPDGSALAGGDAMALLWRPNSNEPFARVAPPLSEKNNITGISLPTSDRAWISTDTGLVLAGEMSSPGQWSWRTENKINAPGSPVHEHILGSITQAANLPLRAIAIDDTGRGYAVGDQGLVLERTGDTQSWRRLRGPGTDNLTSVTLGQAEGAGALIGGQNGVVWTLQGSEIQVARPADYARGQADASFAPGGPTTGPVVGMALLPGYADGQSEAWVAIQERGPGTNRMLHYTNTEDEPLLNPAADTTPLTDTPSEREGELRLAAYGKSDCQSPGFCPPMIGSGESSEVALARIADAVEADSTDFALFTGDATDSTGTHAMSAANYDELGDPIFATAAAEQTGQVRLAEQPRTIGARKHRRFAELAIDPLEDAGIPLLGAIGPGDTSRAYYRPTGRGVAYDEPAKSGENLAWREGLAFEPAPWGTGDEPSSEGNTELTESPGAEEQAQSLPEATVEAQTEVEVIRPVEVKNGARTHYAADLVRDGEPQARIVVVDSSLRGLAAADAVQNPIERDGQLGFLERMLCFKGQSSPSGGECTREPSQEAIVLSNTPTYTYGPIDPTALATDGAALESLYLRYRVSAVISGRLGWNGLYYALRPGLHTPCPGDDYPEHPPEPGIGLCESVAARLPTGDPTGGAADTAAKTAETTAGADVAQILDAAGGGEGIVPFVVASGAGGKFGPNGEAEGSASDGFWHGYSLVRVPADGDPRGVIVEQRPILDTLAIEGSGQVLGARQRLKLRGIGREPIAMALRENNLSEPAARYDEIASQAITHRYDLLLADPDQPWLACNETDPACTKLQANLAREEGQAASASASNNCSPYLCLPKPVATIDRTTGEVRAGDGRYPDTQAIALLSVGEMAATYPLTFKKSPSFVVKSPLKSLGAPPTNNPRTPPPPETPPSPELPQIPKIEVPAIPAPPAIPSLSAAAPPELQPPAPPAPPPPSQQPAPLDLTVAPPGVSISTPTALIQPPTPPVNPAPPGGARREARQRQAAAQKGGAEGSEGSEETQGSGGDMADGRSSPHGSQSMTRLEATRRGTHAPQRAFPSSRPNRPAPSFTALTSTDQPSTWARGALYGSGIGFAALVLAFSWLTVRPGGRRREPEVPAVARSWAGRERR